MTCFRALLRKGSSALRAALLRGLLDETALLAGVHEAILLWHIKKLYNFLRLASLLRIAADFGAPALVVAFESQMFLAPRYLRNAGGASLAAHPTLSGLAGSCLGGFLLSFFSASGFEENPPARAGLQVMVFMDGTASRDDGTADHAVQAFSKAASALHCRPPGAAFDCLRRN